MEIIENLEKPFAAPTVLTIGNFDGVHLGHQTLLKKLCHKAHEENKKSVVITFANHPSEILRPNKSILYLCTLPHRLRLLEHAGIDVLLLQKFTKEFSHQSAKDFLTQMHRYFSFSHLILGHDATIGREKEGTPAQVQQIAQELGFEVEYLPPWHVEGQLVSSTSIREHLQKGNLKQVEQLLGRPYSIYGQVTKGIMDVSKLCLPPNGSYSVFIKSEKKVSKAILEGTVMKIDESDELSGLFEIIFR